MSRESHMLPVWFFIGVLLTIYGVIIFATSLIDFSQPTTVVLAKYHAGLFGGIILLIVGAFYTFFFWPGRRNKS